MVSKSKRVLDRGQEKCTQEVLEMPGTCELVGLGFCVEFSDIAASAMLISAKQKGIFTYPSSSLIRGNNS